MLNKISYNPAIYKTNYNTQTSSNIHKKQSAPISFGILPAKAVSKRNIDLLEKIAEKLTQGHYGSSIKKVEDKVITVKHFPRNCGEITVVNKNGSLLKINNIVLGDALNIEYLEKTKNPTTTSMRIAYGRDGKGYEFEPGEILRFRSEYLNNHQSVNVERVYYDRSVVNNYFDDERLRKFNCVLNRILPDALL